MFAKLLNYWIVYLNSYANCPSFWQRLFALTPPSIVLWCNQPIQIHIISLQLELCLNYIIFYSVQYTEVQIVSLFAFAIYTYMYKSFSLMVVFGTVIKWSSCCCCCC